MAACPRRSDLAPPAPPFVRIASPHVQAQVETLAGRVWDPRFRLPDGRFVAPLAKAPWADDPGMLEDDEIPGHLKRLGGEFLGLPFGGQPLAQAVAGWPEGGGDAALHGPAANAVWRFTRAAGDRARLRLEYPEGPIAYAERIVRCAPHRAALLVEARIHARAPAQIPCGFHPVFRLPDRAGALDVSCVFDAGFSYPGPLSEHSRARPGGTFRNLDRTPAIGGGTADFSRLPHGPPREDLAQLCGMRGPVTVRYLEEGFEARLDWDRTLLPHCLIWISDRGVSGRPWEGRFRGLGIEPCASAFDLPGAVSAGENPLSRAGWTTSLSITPARPARLRLRLEILPLRQT